MKSYINYAETCTEYHVALYSRLLRFDFSLVAGATRPECHICRGSGAYSMFFLFIL